MQELDDNALLREYADHESEEAFAALVSRHVNKVYSVALRHTGNPHQAEEITQAVFVILARKSRQLGKSVILEGWLYQTARLTALSAVRGDIRRARREQEAHMQTIGSENENEADTWNQIAPLLDSAIADLNEKDRHAVVLRFFYGKSLKEVGAALGGSEGAATVRMHRALEKLRQFFARHGVSSTTAVLAGAISAHSVQAAPAALATSATAVGITKGLAASGSTLTLINGALKIMAQTKIKIAVVVGAGMLILGGAGLAIYKVYHPGRVIHVHNQVKAPLPGRAGTLSKGLVGLWSGDGNALDTAGGNKGVLQNVSFADGVVGRAFSFPGNFSAVQIPDDPAYELTHSLTIEGWIHPRANSGVIFFRGDHRPGLDPYALSMDSEHGIAFVVTSSDDITVDLRAPVEVGVWTHIAAVVDDKAGTMSIYTNGALASQTNTTVRPLGPLLEDETPGVGIGNVNDGGNNFPFMGEIDEIALYNRALSAAEINSLYEENAANANEHK